MVCVGLIISSTTTAQTDKTVVAFNQSIEQESIELHGAIETITDLKDSTSYEVNMFGLVIL